MLNLITHIHKLFATAYKKNFSINFTKLQDFFKSFINQNHKLHKERTNIII